MILQAVVHYRYLFTDIYVGWPGRVHDARVLANSPLYAKASSGSLFPNSKKNINGIDVPVMLLGDPAYPLKEWLMKGFSDCGRLTNPQKKNNYRLSRARVVVENAFGRLKGRWRILLQPIQIDTDFVPTLVSACCVLHNICELFEDGFDEDLMPLGIPTETAIREDARHGHENATVIRRSLVQHFSQ